MNEQKNLNFRRLAEKRVNVIVDKIRVLSNLSNTGLYHYSDLEVKRMFDAVDDALKIAKASFKKGERETKKRFSFE